MLKKRKGPLFGQGFTDGQRREIVADPIRPLAEKKKKKKTEGPEKRRKIASIKGCPKKYANKSALGNVKRKNGRS